MSVIRYFELPFLLWLAPLFAAAVAVLLVATFRRRRRRLARIGTTEIVARLVPVASARTSRVRPLLLGLAAACATIAFAGPRWGTERTLVSGGGVDVVLALDASLSMLATDERPNRLERMKQEARRLLSASAGDRFGLIAFAGRSYILTPLTVDRGALELFLDNLDPSVVGQAGSSLSRTIRQGTDLLLTTRGGSDRALVIMTDGEAFEPEEDVVEAARRAAESGITLVAVGFGTRGGSTIPVRTANGVAPKRDENGEVVVTRFTPTLLQAAVEAGQGAFIDASATDKASRVRSALASLRRAHRSAQAGRERRARFQLFVLPAVLLAFVDTLLAERRGRRRRAPAAATAATAAALLLLLATPDVGHAVPGDEGDSHFRAGRYAEAAAFYRRAVEQGDRSPRTLYNLGTALLAAGRLTDALDPLERAASAREMDVRYRALFNLGLANLRRARSVEGEAAQQSYAAATDAYKRALRLRPHAVDAKWNYELANREKDRDRGGGGGGGGQPQQPDPSRPPQVSDRRPSAALDAGQAAQLLNSAAREEREVQGRRQRQTQPERPPGGKDW